MKIALCLIVKGTNEEADLLDRCLTSMSPLKADGIFVTRTHKKGEEPNDAVALVAKQHNAHLSDFEWINDFAAARNFNFSQVPSDFDYIIWSDADDLWRGLDKVRPTLEEHPHMDAFGLWYLYDFDEWKKPTVVHKKTMIVKNDGCVEWVGRLHEDLMETRQLDVFIIEGIERLHVTSPLRVAQNARRNLQIAEEEKEGNDDPRADWNLANAQFAAAQYDAAAQTFERFIHNSGSEDERYLALCRIADIKKAQGASDDAVRYLQTAIGLAPTIPDAYFQLAYLYYSYQNYDKAEEYCLQGLVRKPQIHRMIVYNPRDYDYNPMMLLAQIYYHKNRPDLMLPLLEGCLKIYPDDENLKRLVKEGREDKELMAKALTKIQHLQKLKDKKRLKKEIDELPLDIRSHPAVCALRNQHFIKEEASGRDLVIYCGNTTHQWNGVEGRYGGSEEAVVNIAREFAKLGWNVTVYNNCGYRETKDGSVIYRPFWEWNYRDKQDIVILWRWPKPLDAEINADKIFLDLHDVVQEGEFTERRLARVSKIFVKSKFHRSLIPNVPDDKVAIVPNGIDLSLFEKPVKKDPYLIINTSSPDRSMDVLPRLFKEVKKRVPKAKLQWAYGWDVFDASYRNDEKKMAWRRETQRAMTEAGIKSLGKLSQADVAKLYQKASILAYPTEFAEIDCISVKKAQAAGCYPVATDFGALYESIEWGAKVHSPKTKDTWNAPYQFHFGLDDPDAQQEWIEATIKALTSPLPKSTYIPPTWPVVAKRWISFFV